MAQSRFSSDDLHLFLEGKKIPKKIRNKPEKKGKGKRFTFTSKSKSGELKQKADNLKIISEDKKKIFDDGRFYFIISFSDTYDWPVIRHIMGNLNASITNVHDNKTIKVAVKRENYDVFAEKLEEWRKYITDVTESYKPISDEVLNQLKKDDELESVTLEAIDFGGIEYAPLLENVIKERLLHSDETISLSYNARQFAVFVANLHKETIDEIIKKIEMIENVEKLPRIELIANVGGRSSGVGLASMISVSQPAAKDLPLACVIDSGINRDHKLLQGYVFDTFDFSTKNNGPCNDVYGHGTKVAGIVVYGGNVKNHTTAISRIIMVKGFDDNGNPLSPDTISMVKESVERFSKTCTVYNLSFAGFGPNRALTRVLDDIVFSKNVSIVACAGNIDRESIANYLKTGAKYPDYLTEKPIYFPGDSHNSVTIGSITTSDSNIARKKYPSPFTRTGTNYDEIKPDVVEYGGNLKAEYHDGKLLDITHTGCGIESASYKNNFEVLEDVGTSFSTPAVSSLMSMIMAYYPTALPFLAKAILLSSCLKLKDAGNEYFDNLIQGFGLPDLPTAVFSQQWRASYLIQGEFDGTTEDYHHYNFYFPEGVDRLTITMVVGKPAYSEGFVTYKTKKAGVKASTRVKPEEIVGPEKKVSTTHQSIFNVRHGGIGSWPLDIFPHYDKTPGRDVTMKYGCVITVESTKSNNIYSRVAGWVREVQRTKIPEITPKQ